MKAFAKTGLAMIAGPLCVSLAAPSAEEGWKADTAGDRCALQFHRAASGVFFELALNPADASYSLRGTAFGGYSQNALQQLRVAIKTGRNSVALSDDWQNFGKELLEARGGTPVPAFFEALDKSEMANVTLVIGGDAHAIGMAGYDEAREALRGCADSFVQAVDPVSQPRLIAFTGLRKLVAEAGRQNLLAQRLSYTLTIDPTGKPIKCEYSRRFRRKATRLALCRPLLKTMSFEPARDASGNRVEGTFEGLIDFQMWMSEDGYLSR